ncbi:putative DNA-binding transcriptional regulator AlpA [Rhizobium leguminosarum]|uniref:DNA-binding transcriptional regulator AlpA n=1 Tax=Rhizobium leguminosarum TaxID=384 RepID=A0AAE2MHY3_RHILE|nr:MULTISPECIES: helix-turn-helix domain-containing protein [Rhizobium]MBB4289504.1 putative DNA-binding transcriptional regulator AlpA [Rhizobium leguminosarum]MBB4294400.1 putative DNA-binding transcriptional regulator AlpA [Rhizobium leguminosarum]MBB4305796.1 putative DNA-binding transcriptional regulator AlpA [Rhizobium leguminosarum]MBB4418627.1 putative DNA-binding transcriptional regulator AlpA [Rhizobium leguminosarum]MBB4433471.1 putative DNA-binding transcriptional regulator AlpA [R
MYESYEHYSLNEILRILTISRSTLYRMRRRGKFVAATDMSDSRIAFLKSAVHGWLKERGMPLPRPPRYDRSDPNELRY